MSLAELTPLSLAPAAAEVPGPPPSSSTVPPDSVGGGGALPTPPAAGLPIVQPPAGFGDSPEKIPDKQGDFIFKVHSKSFLNVVIASENNVH